MVRKSYGKMRGTRFKLKSQKTTINMFMQRFAVGDVVKIDFVSHRMPHPKFQGLTGRIVQNRGSGYGVEVADGNKTKVIFLKPEHLKR